MNERNIFIAAISIEDPDQREAYLEQVCGDNAGLRQRVVSLLQAFDQAGSYLEHPVQRLAAETPREQTPLHQADVAQAELQKGYSASDRDEVGLSNSFLTAVTSGDAAKNHLPEPQEEAAWQDGKTQQPSAWSTAGTVIAGRYTLLERIGEGGMGEVWIAKQSEPVRRKVAIKLIKVGMDSRAVLTRFEQERQALALMDHPNIAKVLDGGVTEMGHPFFVMELVNGLAVNKFCDQAKLTPRERLELFVPICHAIQHAHQKGIVHRDLKPANILVTLIDGKPVPKVIDFGVAKAIGGKLTEETLWTQFGAVVGTLEYMSPEQAGYSGADIDTRSDIYSLGVVLYELMTGVRPLDGNRLKQVAMAEMIRMIVEDEPSRPSTRLSTEQSLPTVAALQQTEPKRLMAFLRGDLDWVIMKCLEKERNRRYESANGLARDIQRVLTNELVEARPPSQAYRIKKFIRRNRAMVTTVGAVAAALVIGIIGFAWQAYVANEQRALAEQAREAANEQRDRAVKAEQETAKRVEELKHVSEFQADMLANVDPTQAGLFLTNDVLTRHSAALAQAGVPEPERDARRQSFAAEWQHVNAVDTAVAFIDREILAPAVQTVSTEFEDQPLVRAQLKAVLASLYSDLGQFNSAQPLAEQVLGTRRQELGENHPDTLLILGKLGWILVEQAKHVEAEACYREALTRGRNALGGDHEVTRKAEIGLASTLTYQGKYAEAEQLSRDLYERNRRLAGPDAEETRQAMAALGIILGQLGEEDESIAMLKAVMESYRRVEGNDSRDTLLAIANYAELTPPAEREILTREVFEGRRRVLGEEHFETIWAMGMLARVLVIEGKLSEAETQYREAVAKMREIRGDDHPNTIAMATGLGSVLRRQGKYAEAEEILREVLDKSRRLYGSSTSETTELVKHLAIVLEQSGRYAEAEPLFRESLETQRVTRQVGHPDIATGLENLARVLQAQNKLAEAEPLLREALAIRDMAQPAAWATFNTRSLLGGLLLAQEKISEAEPLLVTGYGGLKEQEASLPLKAQDLMPEALKRLVELYKIMHATNPDKGYDAKAIQFEKELEARQQALPEPTPTSDPMQSAVMKLPSRAT